MAMDGTDKTIDDCIFCKIAKGEISTDFIYKDENIFIIRDLNPQAPTHLLVIPALHIKSAAEVNNPELWSSIMGRAVDIARRLGLDKDGFRMVINTGTQGGQTVPHLHLHLMSGRNFGWPPG